MRTLSTFALAVAICALPACAQRGGGHMGFSGHAGFSGGHAGFSGFRAPAPRGGQAFRAGLARPGVGRYAGLHPFGGTRPFGSSTGLRGWNPRNPVTRGHYPGGDRNRGRFRGRYISSYAYAYAYPYYSYWPWLDAYDPYLFDFGDNADDSDTSNVPPSSEDQSQGAQAGPSTGQDKGPYPGGDYGPPPPGYYPPYPSYAPLPRPPYQPSSAAPAPLPAPATEQAVTLVFKDGRPPEQIHNYVLTRTMLYVQDGHHRSIPLDQLDLVATGKVNEEAGVDFSVPGSDE